MDLSYKWLKELTGVDWPVEEMGERLTLSGTACEYIRAADAHMDRVVVGEVTDVQPVEGASKIKLATVNLGKTKMDVICGAPNVDVGQTVPVALEGARLAGDMVIKKVKIRGIESSAMICSERELGISDDHSGIMVLEDDARVGVPLAEQLDYNDYIMTFELTPNRADSMSAIGIARDLAALASTKVIKPATDLKESSQKADSKIKVRIEDPVGCPRYAARIIRNVKIGPSPWWMKKKLLMSGVRPISNIVDITNLVMLETGHPLHAFDLERFGSDEVVVRRAADKEKFVTLDGAEHTLSSQVLLITNGKTGVAAGGIMGGLDSEVESSTTDILLEAAYFDPVVIRRGRKELGMVTESSMRFEKGADPNGIPYAINRAASLMQQLCGGEVLAGIVDCYPEEIKPKQISLRPARCNYVLGVHLSEERMKEVLTGLEFRVSGKGTLETEVPTFRPDITREIDLIEEIARIDGYDKIPDATANIGPLFTPIHFEDKFRSDVRRLLTGCGFDEMVNHGLTDSHLAALLNPDLSQVKILNPVSADLDIMRNTLVQTTLNVISHNIAHRNVDLCLFELGKAYQPGNGEDDWCEYQKLSLAVSGNTPHTWRDKPRSYDFSDLAGALSLLGEHFGWGRLNFEPQSNRYFEREISFAIMCGNIMVGIVGKMNRKIAAEFEIKQDVYLAELDLNPLIAISGRLTEYQPLPVYPAAPRDLAVVVDDHVRAGELVETVKEAGGEMAESVEIFDLYRGKQIAAGKKSVAISINYRSKTGNLTAAQVDERQAAVVNKLKEKFKAQIRDK
ncbi:MAG: phenylalanine--tRNA ligase subunit beta [Candidatus Zixiibacteriota bacterium]|nr:MAG: phenylalanine--tRNA ligase subunit beta [candidate division Zixibacteria bacterium]